MVQDIMPRWLLFSLISSLLCILGGVFVPVISWYSSGSGTASHKNNTKLVNYGLSLSAGCMITTSMYKMLPQMETDNKYIIFIGFSLGILISFFLNFLVHAFTSESLVHCAHGDTEGEGGSVGEITNGIGAGRGHMHSVHFRTEHLENPEAENGYGRVSSVDSGGRDAGSVEDTPAVQSEHTPLVSTQEHNNNIKGVNRRISIRDFFSKENRESGPCCGGIIKSCGVLSMPSDKNTCLNPQKLHHPSITSLNNSNMHNHDEHEENEMNNDNNNNNNDDIGGNTDNINDTTNTTNQEPMNNNISPNNSSYEDDDYMYDADDKSYHQSQGIACVENNIGYDLENLDTYRKNYMTGRRNTIEYAPSITHSVNPGPRSVRSQAVSRVGLDPQLSRHSHSHNHYGTSVPPHLSTDEEMDHDHGHHHSHYDEELGLNAHHHHLETPFSKLLSIGLQTCLVLTLHKFPEGLIIFYTNQSDSTKSLGLSIFISLLLHNFVEGFAMTLPFYTAFESKWKAVLITAVLGGGSQPLGALIGYFIFTHSDHSDQKPGDAPPGMNFLLSITAGFLTVISLQMFQTAVSFSDNHHHHTDDDEHELEQNHTMGTTCLKWSCAGICLILISGIFV
ncbi:Zn(2+) transporter ZRT3 [Nakaseomyces bracarensis]|uniref:Zn(2+) transporter ZRT3 n=1 Tax=Nakaseomyces bracarensis TaxID=273131 RepID=UPI003870FF79